MDKTTTPESSTDRLNTTVSGRLHKLVMSDPNGVNLDKRAFVRKQTEQAMNKGRPFVRCGCLKKLQMPEAYKCLYCGEWYCAPCAEEHFGKTREEYQEEKEQRRCSGYKVFPNGDKCEGCSDCQQKA